MLIKENHNWSLTNSYGAGSHFILSQKWARKLCRESVWLLGGPQFKSQVCLKTSYISKRFSLQIFGSANHTYHALASADQPFSNISEIARPIKAKFCLEPPWEGGTKVCINGSGHMTKMAAIPIHGKNLKISSPNGL